MHLLIGSFAAVSFAASRSTCNTCHKCSITIPKQENWNGMCQVKSGKRIYCGLGIISVVEFGNQKKNINY